MNYIFERCKDTRTAIKGRILFKNVTEDSMHKQN